MGKRDRLKELWLNRPSVYIPEVVALMKSHPYNRKTHFFWRWLADILRCCWTYRWRY